MAKLNKQYGKRIVNMAINPYHDGDLLEMYPILKECLHDKVSDALLIDKYFRYCSFVLDPQSPMFKDYPDMRLRRQYASEETKWDGVKDYRIEVLMLKKLYRSREHSMIITAENMMDEYLDILNNPLSIENENDLIKALDLKNKLINHYEQLIELRDKMVKKMSGADEGIEEEMTFNPTPERMAKMKKNVSAD